MPEELGRRRLAWLRPQQSAEQSATVVTDSPPREAVACASVAEAPQSPVAQELQCQPAAQPDEIVSEQQPAQRGEIIAEQAAVNIKSGEPPFCRHIGVALDTTNLNPASWNSAEERQTALRSALRPEQCRYYGHQELFHGYCSQHYKQVHSDPNILFLTEEEKANTRIISLFELYPPVGGRDFDEDIKNKFAKLCPSGVKTVPTDRQMFNNVVLAVFILKGRRLTVAQAEPLINQCEQAAGLPAAYMIAAHILDTWNIPLRGWFGYLHGSLWADPLEPLPTLPDAERSPMLHAQLELILDKIGRIHANAGRDKAWQLDDLHRELRSALQSVLPQSAVHGNPTGQTTIRDQLQQAIRHVQGHLARSHDGSLSSANSQVTVPLRSDTTQPFECPICYESLEEGRDVVVITSCRAYRQTLENFPSHVTRRGFVPVPRIQETTESTDDKRSMASATRTFQGPIAHAFHRHCLQGHKDFCASAGRGFDCPLCNERITSVAPAMKSKIEKKLETTAKALVAARDTYEADHLRKQCAQHSASLSVRLQQSGRAASSSCSSDCPTNSSGGYSASGGAAAYATGFTEPANGQDPLAHQRRASHEARQQEASSEETSAQEGNGGPDGGGTCNRKRSRS